jgi:hypothetical protein
MAHCDNPREPAAEEIKQLAKEIRKYSHGENHHRARASPRNSPVSADAWVSSGQPVTAPGERTKRFTFDVPESLRSRVKAACASGGTDMAHKLCRILLEHFPNDRIYD